LTARPCLYRLAHGRIAIMKRMARPVPGYYRPWFAFFALITVSAVAEPAPVDSRKPEIPRLEVETYTLPNGLTVILHEDHKTPVVSVNVLYKVGSKDEKLGRTGFAHLFEHMMFQGSKNHDTDYFLPLEKMGAQLNGETAEDQTVYYETVPSNALELALWLEADRMGFLLPSMTQQKLDNQRDVVKNERRQSVDNVPYGKTEEMVLEALYPTDHPYHHSVIGSMADLSAAALADVAAFFRTYYVPNNAILCIAGDFQPSQAKQWIEKYFGPLSRGPEVKPPSRNIPSLSAPKQIRSTDAVSLPRAQLIWPTVPVGHPDEPALDVLATILGGLPKENRLFRVLMYDRQLAASVSASHPTQLLSGTFEVELYARPGENFDDLKKIADAEIELLKKEGPTPLEVTKAQNERESALIMGLQSATRKASV
jgi:zinc protease